jgi:hypothetical protein
MTALLDRIVGVIAGFQSREASLRGSGGLAIRSFW